MPLLDSHVIGWVEFEGSIEVLFHAKAEVSAESYFNMRDNHGMLGRENPRLSSSLSMRRQSKPATSEVVYADTVKLNEDLNHEFDRLLQRVIHA